MKIYRQLASLPVVAVAFLLTIPAAAALAEHASITVPNVGQVTLDFQPAPHGAGNFRSIAVNSVGKTFRFVPKVPVAQIPADADDRQSRGLWDKVPGLRLDPSPFFFRGEYISDSQPHTLLFFISEAGASDASPLFVVEFSYVGVPYEVLQLGKFDITAFQRAGDNTALIIGKQTLSQVMGGDGGNGSKAPYATTYDPFSVFIVHVKGSAYYSLAASRRYNQQHYVWAGPHSREDYAVLYNLPGHSKPFGASASHVDNLLSSAKGSKAP